MLRDFDEFVNFCFEHGGTLRNHKAFGEMSRELREKIASLEVRPTPLAPDDAYASCPFRAFVNYPALGDVVECEYRIAGKA